VIRTKRADADDGCSLERREAAAISGRRSAPGLERVADVFVVGHAIPSSI
jgi:hypothetical protein